MKMIKFFLTYYFVFALCHSYPHRISSIAKSSLKYIGAVPTRSQINPSSIVNTKTKIVSKKSNVIVKKTFF